MIFSIKPGGTLPESRARSARRAHATAVSVEALEGRTLLSHGGNRPPVLVTTGLQTPMVFRGPDPGPIHNVVGHGFAIKVPRFYAWYHGQKRAELNGAGAAATGTHGSGKHSLSHYIDEVRVADAPDEVRAEGDGAEAGR